jgi:hypothetical protein
VFRGVFYVPDKMGYSTAGAKRRPVQSGFQLDRCMERIDRCGAWRGLMLQWIGGNGLWFRCSIKHAGREYGKRYQA